MHDGLKRGFTMIELSISIVFIAILSITVVLIVNNSVSSYHRGLTLSQINTVGMDLVDDVRATVQNSPSSPITNECKTKYPDENGTPYKKCIEDDARGFVVGMKTGSVDMGGGKTIGKKNGESPVPLWGVFCTGTYSYIWNTGYFFNKEYKVEGGSMISLSYPTGSGANARTVVSGFKLLKVQDDKREVCGSMLKGDAYQVKYPDDNTIKLSTILNEPPMDLMAGAEDSKIERSNLALYDFNTATPTSNNATKDLFYSLSFILGTVQGGVNVASVKGNYCATPNDYAENFDYCSINKFNFAVRATGG